MLQFDTTYLNRTANQTPRAAVPGTRPLFVVWHETASPRPTNPYGTLEYNLSPRARSSYHYLVARDGTIFHYLDPRIAIAWHAGVHDQDGSPTQVDIAGTHYRGFAVNAWSIGVELDGACDGTPISSAQRDGANTLLHYLHDTFAIPLERSHHLMHREITAPSYRHDPRGYDIGALLAEMPAMHHPRPDIGLYSVDVALANVREGPSTIYPVALHGAARFGHGAWLQVDGILNGEAIEGNPWWGHLVSAIGFIWMGLVVRVR